MAKGIIVVDVPKTCEKCQFNRGLNVCKIMQYTKNGKHIYTTDKQVMDGKTPDWCPIKPFANMKNNKDYTLLIDEHFRRGWNACIDEILKEG